MNFNLKAIEKLGNKGLFDMILSSIPFSNHYEYSTHYNDFGHNMTINDFWSQMDYLTPNLLKVLKPGRIAAIHVKDRILYGHQTPTGFMEVAPFSDECQFHFRKHGFLYMGRITVVTDVVRENNSTYRLGWTEMSNDGTKMGVGLPEYVLIFRKPPTSNEDQRADEPVTKVKSDHYVCTNCGFVTNKISNLDQVGQWYLCPDCHEYTEFKSVQDFEFGYSRGRWQIDAHSFWRSDGNRPLTAAELYNYEAHVKRMEHLEAKGNLPAAFMYDSPESPHESTWTDIQFMQGLNANQSRKRQEQHLCLARNSQVLTKEFGYIPIQNVQVGNQVLTHKGRWRSVLAVQNTGIQQAVTIKAHGVPGLTLTPDHKLWCRRSTMAREREGAENISPDWVEAQYTLKSYINSKLPPSNETCLTDNPLHWWIIGRWIADGHWDGRGAAIISCGTHELENLLSKLDGHAGGVYDSGTAFQIRILDSDRTIRNVLDNCGHGAENKRLPSEAYTLPIKLAEALLSGYLSGDGHFLEDRQRWMASSVSRILLLGMVVLVQRVYGSIASLYEGRPEREAIIEGRKVHCKQDWVMSFDINPNHRRQKPFLLDDGAWRRVRVIEDAGMVETWNLRVAEDESYTAEGCIVKNCPLPFDLVNRLIRRYSNEGDVILEPFAGLGTVPYCAIKLKRRAYGIELWTPYYQDGLAYNQQADLEAQQPTLFDLLGIA